MKSSVVHSVLILLAFRLVPLSYAQETAVDPVIVRADRLPDTAAGYPFRSEEVTAEELQRAPQLRLDDLLRAQVPGFSLFRRSSSRVANPTTQGVTLRNFAPSGAGRTLVLLDGIPLNDPFAGYVLWNQIPPPSLESVFVTPGGGAGLFGNAALAGTIFLNSRRAQTNEAMLQGSIGNTETAAGSIAASVVDQPVMLSLFAESFRSGGYPVLQADQRGPVDTNASSESDLIQLGAELALTARTSLSVRARTFREERGNGTLFTRNDTSGFDGSVALTSRIPELQAELRLTAYGQQRKYRSTFSAVNLARDAETPALDQFHVPANAAGGGTVWTMSLGTHLLTLGGDLRSVEGETNEAFRYVGNAFTRTRTAGGKQVLAGIFAEDSWQLTSAAKLVGSVRLDHWSLTDGTRTERDRLTNNPILSARFPDRDDYSVNGRLGTHLELSRQWSARAAAYTGFRVPTLNELYRPFRVGNAVTEANPELQPERLIGGEAGLESNPTEEVRLAGTVFYNRLEDAIGNITIGVGPGLFNPGGFIPAGGVLRQRQNVELVTAPGVEFTADWRIATPLLLRGTYLFTQPTIRRATEASLAGNLLAQTPRHVLTGAIEWKPVAKWVFTAQARYTDRQFEDDQNTTALAAFLIVDAAIAYDFSDKLSGALKIENLFNAEIETGKSIDGLVSIGSPRLISLQVQCRL